jgi:hypothetical protein
VLLYGLAEKSFQRFARNDWIVRYRVTCLSRLDLLLGREVRFLRVEQVPVQAIDGDMNGPGFCNPKMLGELFERFPARSHDGIGFLELDEQWLTLDELLALSFSA